MKKDVLFYTSKSLASWDEAGPVHREINKDLFEQVCSPEFNTLESDFDRLVSNFDLIGKSVIQICCNNAKDLISIKKKGAGRCVGIDGSQEFIEQAIALAKAAGYPEIEFTCCNVYRLPDCYSESFDFVVITVGVLNWMPDLERFTDICASFLRPGGYLLMEEIHPVLNMYEQGNPSHLAMSYFNREPQRDDQGLDYFQGKKYPAKENYNFHHTLGDILSAAIANHLVLQSFEELGKNVGNWCADLENSECKPPMAIVASWKKIKY
ncbi:class I SAM-dependent methyltransferase [Microbulbifer epialgicus]|uniref:Class I SAM-dependent methyltransferase n=1 Tax=Microbulbifer epialgicus TaxID=393907 RepID=A0ABV4P749_9GAMM